jgi:YHS domain-containing protein
VKIGFSVRAWVLSAAAGLVVAGTMYSGKAPLTADLAAQTQTADAVSTETKQRPKHSSLQSYLSRNRRTNSQIEADSIAEDTGIRQVSNEVVPADGSATGEPRKLIERPATREAISNSRPARNTLFPSLFQRPAKGESESVQQPIVTPREDDGRSAVQRRLEELYRENGQEMPPMDLGDLPSSGVQQDIPPLPKAADKEPEPIQQVSNNPFKRFFTKISPFRKKENDERPEHVEKMPQSLRQEQQRVQQQFNAQPALPSVGEPELLSEESQREAIQAIEKTADELPKFQPAVELPEIALPDVALPDETTVPQLKSDLSDELIGETPEPSIPTLDDIPSIDDVLGNPFPEVSEAEADGVKKAAPAAEPLPQEATPFSGLALESEPAPLDAPALTDAPAPLEVPSLSAAPAQVEAQVPRLPDLPAPDLTGTEPAAEPLPAVPELPELPEVKLPEPQELPLVEDNAKEAAPSLEVPDENPLPEIKPAGKSPQDDAKTKLQKIAQRKQLKGLKGFCPVALRDRRDLVDAEPQFSAEFEGRTYNFSSAEALKKFESNPEIYAPANAGIDVVAAQEEADIEGTLDHAVWYKNRLFLFSSQQTLDQFSIAPSVYVADDSDEE